MPTPSRASLGCGANDDRAIAVDQEYRAVEQLLMPRQRDRKLLARARRRQQPAPRQIGHRYVDFINRTAMLEAMNFLRERRL